MKKIFMMTAAIIFTLLNVSGQSHSTPEAPTSETLMVVSEPIAVVETVQPEAPMVKAQEIVHVEAEPIEHDTHTYQAVNLLEVKTISTAPTTIEIHSEVSSEEKTEYDYELALMAQTIWGEGRGLSYEEKCQIAWCILNRVDDEENGFPNSVEGVVTQPGQFDGYSPNYPVTDDCYAAAADVYDRWQAEKDGAEVERELGEDYIYFAGDGVHNYYRTVF